MAVDSHATYFGRGNFAYHEAAAPVVNDDNVDGDGEFADPKPIDISGEPPWSYWPGQWGETGHGSFPEDIIELDHGQLDSPRGPASASREDHQRWNSPGQWESGFPTGEAGCNGDNGPAGSESGPSAPASARASEVGTPLDGIDVALTKSADPKVLELAYSLPGPAPGVAGIRFTLHRDDPDGQPTVAFEKLGEGGPVSGSVRIASPAGSGAWTLIAAPYDEAGVRLGQLVRPVGTPR